ncbi:hypothetical protein RIF29_31199 [Crotalaria pallida]|uniref:Uncharacterized protein n=1 Tax=Crotalaria pallida TaxID=3830 RepID=A0AAN9HYP2_CROPI
MLYLLSQTRFPLSSILTHKHVSHSLPLKLSSSSQTVSLTQTLSPTHSLTQIASHSAFLPLLTLKPSLYLSNMPPLSLSLSLTLTIMSPSQFHHSLAIWLMKISNQYSKGNACCWI